MKNDLRPVEEITTEMTFNDMLYKKMQFDLSIVESLLAKYPGDDKEYVKFLLDEYYFFKRVLSVLANEDIPFKACAGLFMLLDVLPTLYDEKENFIGESDTDEDIYKFVIEFGYRQFDEWLVMDKKEAFEMFGDALADYDEVIEKEDEDDDE